MQIIPAIDVLDGRVVRLVQGDFARVTDFGTDPLEVAENYRRAGAQRCTLVNLWPRGVVAWASSPQKVVA